jgi:hypothetical protein
MQVCIDTFALFCGVIPAPSRNAAHDKFLHSRKRGPKNKQPKEDRKGGLREGGQIKTLPLWIERESTVNAVPMSIGDLL